MAAHARSAIVLCLCLMCGCAALSPPPPPSNAVKQYTFGNRASQERAKAQAQNLAASNSPGVPRIRVANNSESNGTHTDSRTTLIHTPRLNSSDLNMFRAVFTMKMPPQETLRCGGSNNGLVEAPASAVRPGALLQAYAPGATELLVSEAEGLQPDQFISIGGREDAHVLCVGNMMLTLSTPLKSGHRMGESIRYIKDEEVGMASLKAEQASKTTTGEVVPTTALSSGSMGVLQPINEEGALQEEEEPESTIIDRMPPPSRGQLEWN